MSRRLRIGSAVVVALLLIGVVGLTAFADTDTGSAANKMQEAYQNFVSKLAANLGMDSDKVSSALETTRKQLLDEAVASGRLTQEQADKMSENKGFGFGCFYGQGFRAPNDGKGPGGMAFRGDKGGAASILGMTSDQLQTELKSGKKLSDIVTEHGMTMEEFNQKMLEYQKEQINQEVADGKLTQEQADKMLQRLEQRGTNPNPRFRGVQ